MKKILKYFKGGSLSKTYLVEDKDKVYVRKDVSLNINREYGFQRWYSQMKRLQRYSVHFPGLFPKLLNYGIHKDKAYFDIEYFPSSINAHDYLSACNSSNKVDLFFDALLDAMSVLHKSAIISSEDAILLYIHEEVEQRLKDCYKNINFSNFIKHNYIIFNGKKIRSFVYCLDEYIEMCTDFYIKPTESFTHGNMTLENILYIPDINKIVFIDPYEENIIDSELAEFSQLLQSANSKYEFYNKLNPTINENNINIEISTNFGVDYFNQKLCNYIKNKFNKNNYYIIRLLEVSQFIRMLPFKMEVDEKKMYFFYGLASVLFHNIKHELMINTSK